MQKRTRLSILAALLTLALMLSACAAQPAPATGAASDGDAMEEEVVEITWLQW